MLFFILLLVLVYKLIVEYCIVYYDHHVFFPNFHVILWTIYVLHSLLDNITIFWGEMNSLYLWLILKHFHYVTITASVFFVRMIIRERWSLLNFDFLVAVIVVPRCVMIRKDAQQPLVIFYIGGDLDKMK